MGFVNKFNYSYIFFMLGFIIHNGLFYVLGGDDGAINLSSVEVYNPQRNVWSLLPQFLNNPKRYISCILIENTF